MKTRDEYDAALTAFRGIGIGTVRESISDDGNGPYRFASLDVMVHVDDALDVAQRVIQLAITGTASGCYVHRYGSVVTFLATASGPMEDAEGRAA